VAFVRREPKDCVGALGSPWLLVAGRLHNEGSYNLFGFALTPPLFESMNMKDVGRFSCFLGGDTRLSLPAASCALVGCANIAC
jgi:hypothetical protein